MNKISVIGLDLAKDVFQVHGVDGEGEVIVRKQLKLLAGASVFRQPGTVSGGYGGPWGCALLVTGIEQTGT